MMQNADKNFCKTVQITENQLYEKLLVDKVRHWLSKIRKEIHVSDLLFLRQAYFNKTVPLPITDEEVGYFTAGKAHHGLIEALQGAEEYREVDVEFEGIKGTIDFIENIPTEIKTTRAMTIAKEEEISEHYITQLGFYCAMTNSQEGKLIIFYLNVREKTPEGKKLVPKFKVYNIRYPDLETIKEDMRKKYNLLKNALETENFEELPKCPEWICKRCKYRELCLSET